MIEMRTGKCKQDETMKGMPGWRNDERDER
jgi:hypothetical protein